MPWSAFWDRNYFALLVPALDPVLRSPFVRGAVSGLGVVNVCAGLVDLAALFPLRHRWTPHV